MHYIRFPGQYFDAETGLHYNRFRYYDPTSGGYISADPIGQRGDHNLYRYARNNPLGALDTFGLDPLVKVKAGVGLVGSGAAATAVGAGELGGLSVSLIIGAGTTAEIAVATGGVAAAAAAGLLAGDLLSSGVEALTGFDLQEDLADLLFDLLNPVEDPEMEPPTDCPRNAPSTDPATDGTTNMDRA